jgi:formyltetrahydrofolate synthetase
MVLQPSPVWDPLLKLVLNVKPQFEYIKSLQNYTAKNEQDFQQFYNDSQPIFQNLLTTFQKIFEFYIQIFTEDPNDTNNIFKILNFDTKAIYQLKLAFTTLASALRNDPINDYKFSSKEGTVMYTSYQTLQKFYNNIKGFYDDLVSSIERFIYDTQNTDYITQTVVKQSLHLYIQSSSYFDKLSKNINEIFTQSQIEL